MSGAYGGLSDEEIEQRQIEAALETGANQQIVEGQMLNDAIQRLLASQAQFNIAAAESALLARTTNPAATAAVNEAIEAVRTAEAAATQGQDEAAEEAVRAAAADASSESMDVFLEAVRPIAGATTALLVSIAVAGAFSARMDDIIKSLLMESPILFALYLFIKNYISINSAMFKSLLQTTLQQCRDSSATPTELLTILLTTAYILKFGFSGLQRGIRTAGFTYSSGGLDLISQFVVHLGGTGANYLALGLQTVNTMFTRCSRTIQDISGKRTRQTIEGSYDDTGVTASYLSGLRGTPDVVQGLTAQTGDNRLHPSATDLQAKAYGYLKKLKRDPVSTAPIVGDTELQEQRNRDRLRRFIRESNVGLPTGALVPTYDMSTTLQKTPIQVTPKVSPLSGMGSSVVPYSGQSQPQPTFSVSDSISAMFGSKPQTNSGLPTILQSTPYNQVTRRNPGLPTGAIVPGKKSVVQQLKESFGLGGKKSTRKYKHGKNKKTKSKKAPKKTRKYKHRANNRKSKKH